MTADRRGATRSARSHRAILGATRDLLESSGAASVSIEAVAARAGVGKQTIYRWWPSKSALIAEAVLAAGATTVATEDPADTGDLRADVSAWLRQVASVFSEPSSASLVRALAAAAAEDDLASAQLYEQFAEPMHRALVGRLAAGVPAGAVRSGADLSAAADALVGALLFRLLAQPGLVAPERSEGVVDAVLGGVLVSSGR